MLNNNKPLGELQSFCTSIALTAMGIHILNCWFLHTRVLGLTELLQVKFSHVVPPRWLIVGEGFVSLRRHMPIMPHPPVHSIYLRGAWATVGYENIYKEQQMYCTQCIPSTWCFQFLNTCLHGEARLQELDDRAIPFCHRIPCMNHQVAQSKMFHHKQWSELPATPHSAVETKWDSHYMHVYCWSIHCRFSRHVTYIYRYFPFTVKTIS